MCLCASLFFGSSGPTFEVSRRPAASQHWIKELATQGYARRELPRRRQELHAIQQQVGDMHMESLQRWLSHNRGHPQHPSRVQQLPGHMLLCSSPMSKIGGSQIFAPNLYVWTGNRGAPPPPKKQNPTMSEPTPTLPAL